MNINSGELKHRILLQKRQISNTIDGYVNETFIDHKKVWARAKNLFGNEYFAALAANAENTIKFTIRYRTDITSDMIIIFNGKTYSISFHDNINHENKYLELKAVETLFKSFVLFRKEKAMDSLNRPINSQPKMQGVYQCCFKLKNESYVDETPQYTINKTITIMTSLNVYIKPGDIIQIDNDKYIASVPLNVMNKYFEINLTLKKDA